MTITCLLVEQNSDLLYLLQRYGEQAGLQIVIATGQEAVKWAREKQPAVILLAADLPGRNSSEVLRALRATPHTRHIPVVMYAELNQQAQILAAGADGCLQLPFLYEEFLAALEDVGVKREASSDDPDDCKP
jgi:two-component system phosphate regulon response regulator PhoB